MAYKRSVILIDGRPYTGTDLTGRRFGKLQVIGLSIAIAAPCQAIGHVLKEVS